MAERDGSLATRAVLALGPATVLTGALYYFGWVRTRAVAERFDIDPELLGYSTADYVLRSVGTAVPVFVGGAGLLWVVNEAVQAWIGRFETIDVAHRYGHMARRLDRALMPVAALVVLVSPYAVRTALSVVLLVAALALIATYVLRHRMRTAHTIVHGELRGGAPLSTTHRVAVTAVAVAASFGLIFHVAKAVGEVTADRRIADLDSEPAVVLTSQTDLHLLGTGPPDVISDGDQIVSQPWAYRYPNLRLFVESNGRWFLLPSDWERNPRVHVVEIDGTVRLDLYDHDHFCASERGKQSLDSVTC